MTIPRQGIDYLSMKIGRAYKHLKEFDSLVVAHCKRPDAYTITEHEDTVNGRYVIRCQYALIDGAVILSLADLVYSLRSGLDQLAWQWPTPLHRNASQPAVRHLEETENQREVPDVGRVRNHADPDQ